MAGRDTKTQYQGVYKRHHEQCALTVALTEGRDDWKLSDCDCDGRYFGVVFDQRAGRTRKTRHLPKAIEARNARIDLIAYVRAGLPVRASTIRLDAAIEKFKLALKDGTARTKKGRPYRHEAANDLRLTLGHFPDAWYSRSLDDLAGSDVQLAIDDWVGQGKSASRIRSRVYALNSLSRWARKRGLTTADPGADVELPADDSAPRDRVASPAEFLSLLAPLEGREQVPLALAAYSSARAAEIRKLGWPEVDFGKLALLLAAGGGKSEAATRVVPIVQPLAEVLQAEFVRQGEPKAGKVCEPLRASRSGELATGPYLIRCRERWDEVNDTESMKAEREAREAKLLVPINLQECRHTCATWLDHAHVSPKVCSEWMGHSTPERQRGAAPITLNRYTHLLDGELERAGEQLDAFLVERSALGRS